MGRAPCCDKASVKKGPWSPEEDRKLKEYIHKYGTGGNWIALPHKAGLKRCGKSCRLRWLNYLRPNIKHGDFSEEEDRIICSLFATIGSRWSIIAAQLPGRTDNDIKNYWNTKLKKKLLMYAHHHDHGSSNKQQQQQLFFPAEPPAAPPLLSLQQHLPSPHSYHSHHHYSSTDPWTTTSLLSAAVMFHNGEQQQQMMMSASCSDNNVGSLGLYFEALCNNNCSSVLVQQQGDGNGQGMALESFVFDGLQLQEEENRRRRHHQALLLAGSQPDHLDAAGYKAKKQPLVNVLTGGGSIFYGYGSEEAATTSTSATSAGVISQQGAFMY